MRWTRRRDQRDMGVVEPMMNGIAANLFAMCRRESQQAVRTKCERMGAQGTDNRVSAEAWNSQLPQQE